MGRTLNTLTDKLGLNRKKVKVTLYTRTGKELDLRCNVHNNKIEIRKFGKEGSIELNPEIESNPLYDKGQRYIVFEGIDATLYPPLIVEQGIGSLSRAKKISNSDSFNRGRRFEREFIETNKNDMLRYALFGIIGLAGLIILINIYLLGQFDAINELLVNIGDNLNLVKASVVPIG